MRVKTSSGDIYMIDIPVNQLLTVLSPTFYDRNPYIKVRRPITLEEALGPLPLDKISREVYIRKDSIIAIVP